MDISEVLRTADELVLNATGKHLSNLEEAILRGVWQGQSYKEIARDFRFSEGYVKVVGSRLLRIFSDRIGNKVSKSNFRGVAERLSASASVAKPQGKSEHDLHQDWGVAKPQSKSEQDLRQDWGDAPDVSVFYGRTSEQDILKQWIVTNWCRLVAVLGMGGIGKTALAVKVAQEVQGEFEYMVWRSLRNAPPLDPLLTNLIHLLCYQQGNFLSDNTADKILLLMQCLREHRCLLVLDDWESILQGGKLAGHYLEGYENYGQLLKVVGQSSHRSCLILKSREKPREIAQLEGPALPVRSLQLSGLGIDAKEILREKGLPEEDQWVTLIRSYRGNPLALKIVAAMIQDFPFNGQVSQFLKDTLLLGDIEYLLHQQFNRLTELETQIMHWLAKAGKPVSFSQFLNEIPIEASHTELVNALTSLGRRSLIEKVKEGSETLFDIQPVMRKYVSMISNR